MTIPYGIVADPPTVPVPTRPLAWELPTDLSREAPCYRCGYLVHPMRLPVDWTADEFAICPLSDFQGCWDREHAARERARRSAEVATAATEGAARAREETPSPVPDLDPERTLLGAARPKPEDT
jgi:hypothetical protein